MIINILLLWLLLAVAVAVFDIKASIGLIIAYLLLVPYSTFVYSFATIEINYIILLIFVLFVLKEGLNRKETFDFSLAKPFLIFCLFLLVGSLLSSIYSASLGLGSQLSYIRRFSIINFLIPIMLWHMCKNENDVFYFVRIIFVCMFIMGLYGIYCFVTGFNPYVTGLSVLFAVQNNFDILGVIERAGLGGKIQSTTIHPMAWSVLLVMTLYASYIFFKTKSTILFYLFVVLIAFNLFVCNVRSGIVAFFVGLFFLFPRYSSRSILIVLFIVLLVFIIGIDTSIFGDYQPFIDSIIYFNDPEKNIGGSSIELRISQLEGAIDLWINGGLLFGNGFGWCTDYNITYGDHPVLLAFESIIYRIIIESGLLGIILWVWFAYRLFKLNHSFCYSNEKKLRFDYWLNNSFIISYIVFDIVTGIFGFNFFLIFLVLMIKNVRFKKINGPRLNSLKDMRLKFV